MGLHAFWGNPFVFGPISARMVKQLMRPRGRSISAHPQAFPQLQIDVGSKVTSSHFPLQPEHEYLASLTTREKHTGDDHGTWRGKG